MIEELEISQPRAVQVVTREELMYAPPGFYRIRTRDRIHRKSGEVKLYGEIQWTQGQRYESDRVHVAHVMLAEASRDFIGYEGLNVIPRADGYKIAEGWCRADRVEIEAGIL